MPHACSECGAEFLAFHGKTCSVECAKARENRRRREDKGWSPYIHTRRARQYSAKQGPVNRIRVAERDDWTCGICQEPIDPALAYPDPASLSMDHVVPLIQGGAHSVDNLQAAHLRCNLAKGTRAA